VTDLRSRLALLLLPALALCLAWTAEVRAQDAAEPQDRASQAAKASPAAAPESEEDRAKLAELEGQIARLREASSDWEARAAEFERVRASAPERLLALDREIGQLQRGDALAIDAGATRDELGAALLGAEQDLSLARRQTVELEAEAAQRTERRKRIPELLGLAKEKLQNLANESPGSLGEVPALAEARQRLAALRRRALEGEIAALQAELASFEARGQLLRKRLDRAERLVPFQEARVEALRKAVAARERDQAQEAAERSREALAQAESLPPSVQGVARRIAEQNADLVGLRAGAEGLPEKIDEVREKVARADEHIARVAADYERLVQKVEAAGRTDSVGMLLRKQRSEAFDVGKYRRFIQMRQDLISSVQLEQLEWQERRRELQDIDGIVERAMSSLDESTSAEDRAHAEALLRELLEIKRDTIDSLIADYEVYFEALVDFDARQVELIEKTEKLLRFIDARVLWVPSGVAVRPSLLADGMDALAWLFSPRYAGQVPRAFGQVWTQAPLVNALALLVLVAWVALRPRIRARLAEVGAQAREPLSTRIAPTLEALAESLLLAATWPGVLGYLGWQLSESAGATQYVRCVASGTLSVALVWISLSFPRQLSSRDGLLQAHFGLSRDAVDRLRREITWLAAATLPAVFLIQVFEERGEELWRESVGRLAFLAIMFCVACFTHLVMRERSGALWHFTRSAPSLAVRRWVWRIGHGVLIGAATLLAGAALRGYYWTALKLSVSVHFSLVLAFLVLVLFLLVLRWSLLARRRLENETAREARATASAADPGGEAGIAAEPELDLGEVDAQTGRLLKGAAIVGFAIGLWLIWSDLLPAVGILREVELWSTTGNVTVELTDADGSARTAVEERVLPVTLADLLLALAIAAVTLATVRNLPGLLEITVFRRLSAGERYAYATIAKYGLTLLGLALGFSAIGVGWSNIQWLVAAVGLGLGFGLQEIFANFVSGLIILFERPIRVGDTVTVGDISGVVSRIRIRATWITGFDRKELVVPNKEFVTNRLINWSLSDPVLRVDIKVGVAYGSDTERTIAVLREVALANPDVLREPEPKAFFLGFGESSLDFELRVFSPDVEHRLPIVHALHLEIDRAFRREGIEIAFPQRDLHIRSVARGDEPA